MANEINWSAIDYDDPCALYHVLQPKYLALIAGDAVQEVEIDGRRMKLAPASAKALGEFVTKLKAECQAKTTGKKRRFAATSRHCR